MATYTVTSQEGAERYGADVGETVELELATGEELAVICAGWLTYAKKEKEANK